MRERSYYSIRTGKNPLAKDISLPILRDLFSQIVAHFEPEGYFQEAFGRKCVDAGFVPGTLGHDIPGVILLELRKEALWPVPETVHRYSEDDIFDVIELLYDHCSKPTKRSYHEYSNCGWHCHAFDREAGRAEFRERVNRVLATYGDGFELSEEGEILALPDSGLEPLLKAPLPPADPKNVEQRVDAARRKFLRHKSTIDERRDAVRDLADVLEFLRPKLKQVLSSEDENDLFNLANNFGIRHHNERQKTGYEGAIWLSWLFYHYLATIHAALHLIALRESGMSS